MLFSSPVFLFFFLPLCLAAYYAAGRSNLVLLAFSLLFYAWGEPVLVLVMTASIVVNFAMGLLIDRCPEDNPSVRSSLLAIGISINLLLLAYFKYFNFFASYANQLTPLFSLPQIPGSNIPLLLGVSFFTFQAMSYLIDVYRRDYRAQTSIVSFALFKTFFPQLIAGPIVRYGEVGSQIGHRRHDWQIFAEGVERFTIGLAKKVLIADVCAVSVDRMFDLPAASVSASVAWAAVILFAVQIYFDFSGYTDMALGLAKMFGFRLPENFNHPYSALSIQDFWRRWHMTLSRWFRDYLYIPLGGSRKRGGRTMANLFVVFFLCGLWHGANVTFIVWGLLHGSFLALERTRFGSILEKWPRPARHAYVLIVVLVSWMIFRATSMEQVAGLGEAMLGFNGVANPLHALSMYVDALTVASAAAGVFLSFPRLGNLVAGIAAGAFKAALRGPATEAAVPLVRSVGIVLLLVTSVAFVGAQTHRAFIYFRF